MFCETTDAGTDQSARRRQTLAALAGFPDLPCFFVDTNCMLHQFHLIVQSLLQETDSFVSTVLLDLLGAWDGVVCGLLVSIFYSWVHGFNDSKE